MKLKESQTVEFKEAIGQLSRAMASLCAFANTDLGTIYFGIDDGGNSRGMTIEKLHHPHKSVLRNGTLGELLFLTKYIEKWGTGIQNIKDWMSESNLPEPIVNITGQDYILTLKRPAKTSGQISGQISWESTKGGLVEKLDIGLVENAWKVLEQIWKQPKITIKEIASNVGISTTTVDKHIAKLKKHKVLERIGGDKGGVWLIPEFEMASGKSDE